MKQYIKPELEFIYVNSDILAPSGDGYEDDPWENLPI